jgi:hypothetical protein
MYTTREFALWAWLRLRLATPPPHHKVEVVVGGGGAGGGGSVASFRALQTKTRNPNMSDSFSFFFSCFLVCLRVNHHQQ